MSSKNDITGDSLTSRAATEQYRDNYDRIFGNKKVRKEVENQSVPKQELSSAYIKSRILSDNLKHLYTDVMPALSLNSKENLHSITENEEHEYSKWRSNRDGEMSAPRMRDNYSVLTEKELIIFTGTVKNVGTEFLRISTGKTRPENADTRLSVDFDNAKLVLDKNMCDDTKVEDNDDTK